jgi:steroid 5-alpha reductase family enzyme
MHEVIKEEKTISVFAKVCIWVSVSMLYTAQVSPVLYRLNSGLTEGFMPYIGAGIMAVAISIEAIADKQKSDAKKVNPNRFCDTGLYKIVRCPNYLGELLFWTGVFVSGLGVYRGGLQWLIAMIGYIMIIYIMFNGAKRLEIRQNKNYGSNQDYLEYTNKTPILLPLVPLYHLEKVKYL